MLCPIIVPINNHNLFSSLYHHYSPTSRLHIKSPLTAGISIGHNKLHRSPDILKKDPRSAGYSKKYASKIKKNQGYIGNASPTVLSGTCSPFGKVAKRQKEKTFDELFYDRVKRYLDSEHLEIQNVEDFIKKREKNEKNIIEEAQRRQSFDEKKLNHGGKINSEINDSSLIKRRISVGNPFIGSMGGLKTGFQLNVKPCVVQELKIEDEKSPGIEKENTQ